MAKIELKDINKSYDKTKILDGINLVVNEGEMTALLGNSGSGKTTILHSIAGIIDIDDGKILFNDIDVTDTPIEKRSAVLVDQQILLFPHLNVENNIAFGLKMKREKTNAIKNKVKELIELLELQGHEKKYPNQLSGGQKQRVAIARALAIEPYVLLLDEPFSKLDITLRESMQKFVCRLQMKLKMTTILVTHDKDEAMSMANKVAILSNGCIAQYDTPENIYEKPISKEVSDLFGTRNYFYGIIKDGLFINELVSFPTDKDNHTSMCLMIRPEDIKISDTETDIKVLVTEKIYCGDKFTCKGEINNFEISFNTDTTHDFMIGDTVNLHIRFKDAVYFEDKNKKKQGD